MSLSWEMTISCSFLDLYSLVRPSYLADFSFLSASSNFCVNCSMLLWRWIFSSWIYRSSSDKDSISCLCCRITLLSSSSNLFFVSRKKDSWLAYLAFLYFAFPYKNLHSLVRWMSASFFDVLSFLSLLISLSISSTSLVLFSNLFYSSFMRISLRLLFRLSYFYLCRNSALERLAFGLAVWKFTWGTVSACIYLISF